MAIFISYSQQDSRFVDLLAANLVKARHHIWLDRWELNLGDSLTQRIEQSLTSSSAILFILSKSSIASNWCKRELTAGLVRELEEKRTLVMPVVIEDCEIPLFLRDKLYADFRNDRDAAFNLIDRSLARLSNPTMSRTESPDFFTDFSFDWKKKDIQYSEETWELRWTFVDHGPNLPYVLLSECKIFQTAGTHFAEEISKGNAFLAIKRLTQKLCETFLEKVDPIAVIGDNFQQFEAWKFGFSSEESYLAVYTFRRMGTDNGMDTVVYLGNNLRMARDHVNETVRS